MMRENFWILIRLTERKIFYAALPTSLKDLIREAEAECPLDHHFGGHGWSPGVAPGSKNINLDKISLWLGQPLVVIGGDIRNRLSHYPARKFPLGLELTKIKIKCPRSVRKYPTGR